MRIHQKNAVRQNDTLMKLAIMQPYFFPYLGYWQLIKAVDKFVIYDDVNFIKGGWINRNRILVKKKEHMITLPLKKMSPNKLINEIEIYGKHYKLIKTITQEYKKAPFFNDIMPLVEKMLLNPEKRLISIFGIFYPNNKRIPRHSIRDSYIKQN